MNSVPFQKLDQFFTKFKKLNLKKRETFMRAGDEPSGVFYLKRGYTRVYSLCAEGEELTLIIFKPEDFFPILWAINDTPNQYYLEAMTACEVYRCPRQDFLKFLKDNPDVLFELTSRIITRFGGVLTRMEYLVFGNAYKKIASILVICAERFGEKQDGEILIQVPLTHKDIATLVGITRETVSLEIKKLERKGLITYRGRLLIVKNSDGLRRESLLDSS